MDEDDSELAYVSSCFDALKYIVALHGMTDTGLTELTNTTIRSEGVDTPQHHNSDHDMDFPAER